MVSPLSQNLNPPPAPAEPCPTPLSTVEVFESFDRESAAWEIDAPEGLVRGQMLGQGPPLYFLNGLEGTSDLYRLLAWLLREEFRSVLFDARPDSALDAKRVKDVSSVPQVCQLFAVADRHEDSSFFVYGSGVGGWVALAAMLAEPNRVRGAIVQSGYAERRFKWLEPALLFLGKRSKRLLKDVPGWNAIFEQNHRRWFPPFDAARWDLFEYIAGHVPVSDLARRAAVIRQVRLANRLGEIKTPVLCLKTEGEGQILSRQQEVLEKRLPHFQKEFLKDTGLVPYWTHPHRIAKIIRQFAEPLDERS